MNDVMAKVETSAQARELPPQAGAPEASTEDPPSPAEVPWTCPSRAQIQAIVRSADEQRVREIRQGLAALLATAARALVLSQEGNWRQVGAMVLVFATLALLAGAGFAGDSLPGGEKRFAVGVAKWMPVPPAALSETQAY
jgi:hypothetical protein